MFFNARLGATGGRVSTLSPGGCSRPLAVRGAGQRNSAADVDVEDEQFNEDYPIGEVLWPMIRASPAMQAKFKFKSQLPA